LPSRYPALTGITPSISTRSWPGSSGT